MFRKKKSKRKQSKPLTRNIFPDLLRVFKILLVSFLIYGYILSINGKVVPFINGFSFYTCMVDYPEMGYYKGDTLVLRKGFKGISLVEKNKGIYNFDSDCNEHSIGAVVYRFNVYKNIVHIYNSILSIIKDKM